MKTLRIITSAVLVGTSGWLATATHQVATLESGKAAGQQLQASDAALLETTSRLYLWAHVGLPELGILAALLLVWWRPIRRALGLTTVAAAAVVVPSLLTSGPDTAYAYYNQHDYAEAYTIMPNESAFWVPDIGDNATSQISFDSAAYLDRNKIAAKRFLVPHHTLRNSGFSFWGDYYVPDGRLFIVDRTPASREWLADPNKGTSRQNEGFACQSSEGHNITVGVAMSANVSEANAAKFLFNFGVHAPEGQRTDPNVVFNTVFYGRSLYEVMDEKIRTKVGTLVCEELMADTVVNDSKNAKAIMARIRATLTIYLESKGITLDNIGWADTWTFDTAVQDALNRHFAAVQDRDIAEMLSPYVTTIQSIAVADALRSKWNGATPSSVSLTFVPQTLIDTFGQLFKASAKTPEPRTTSPTDK